MLPVFWLARKHTGDERARGFTLSLTYLLYPAVQFGALNDFHPVTLAVPLLLFMSWALDEDRGRPGRRVRRPGGPVEGGCPTGDRRDRCLVRDPAWSAAVGGAIAALGVTQRSSTFAS